MLRAEDIDRILEAAEELKIEMTEEDAMELWKKYEQVNGKEMYLPAAFTSVMNIVRKGGEVVVD